MVGAVEPVARTTAVKTGNITTDIAKDCPTHYPPSHMSQPMGSLNFHAFGNSELDFRAPGGIYYTHSYCANYVFGICTNNKNQYFGGGGGGIGALILLFFACQKHSR